MGGCSSNGVNPQSKYEHMSTLVTSSLPRLARLLCCFCTLLQSYDHNCDGVLDFDEFSKGITMCQLDDLFPRSLQRTLFDRIDTDKVHSLKEKSCCPTSCIESESYQSVKLKRTRTRMSVWPSVQRNKCNEGIQ